MNNSSSGRRVCGILDDYQDAALAMADWSAVAERFEIRAVTTAGADLDAVAEALQECEVVVAMRERTPFPAALFDRLPHLRLLVTTGMQNASIDLDAARERGVLVCGTASSSIPPAELTWALILGIARGIAVENAALRANGRWQNTVGIDLAGRRLGIVGLGKIGSRVAAVARAFEMQVQAWSQNLDRDHAERLGVEPAGSLEELCHASDLVTVHLRLSDRSRGLIGAEQLRAIGPAGYLINTARAEIVDQPALLQALTDGWIAGAALDVFDTEPLPAESPLRSLPNVLATPHLGYVTEGNYRRYYGEAVADILAYLDGTPLRRLA